MGSGAAGMHDALWSAFVIEVSDFFAQDEIFEERGAAVAGFQGVLVVGERKALIGGEEILEGGFLVRFAAVMGTAVATRLHGHFRIGNFLQFGIRGRLRTAGFLFRSFHFSLVWEVCRFWKSVLPGGLAE